VALLALAQKLQAFGIDPKLADVNAMTPLIFACLNRNYSLAKFLINAAVDSNASSKTHLSPIGACFAGNFDFASAKPKKSDEDEEEDNDSGGDDDDDDNDDGKAKKPAQSAEEIQIKDLATLLLSAKGTRPQLFVLLSDF